MAENQEPPRLHDLHIQVTPYMLNQVRAAARRADRSMSQWVRIAIRDKLKRDAE